MLISVLLLATSSAAFACALYVDRGHERTAVHRLIYGISFCLMLWGFGLGLRVCAASAEAALIGSRIAPPGYLLLFGLLLHFVLLVTGHEALLRRRGVLLLLYLPGAAAAFGLVVLPCFGLFPTELERTPYGWVNNTANGWLWFYYAYYAVYLVLTLALLLRWRRQSTRERTRRQASLLAGSILAMAVLGSATDALPGTVFKVNIPGVAAAFSILPELVICYSSRWLDFLRPAAPNPDEVILDRLSYANICRVLAVCFMAGGALNLLALASPGGAHTAADTLLFTGVMLAAGLCVLALNGTRRDEAAKELLLSLIASLVVPALTLHYSETGGVTVWVSVFFLLVPGVLFGRRILLWTVLAAAVQSQLVLLGSTGRVTMAMGSSQNAARLGIIAIMAFLCFFVSAVYRGRLRENLRHAARQNAMSRLSRTLLTAGEGNWQEVLEEALAQCGRFLQCDRADLKFAAERERGELRFARAWQAGRGGVPVEDGDWEKFFPAVLKKLGRKSLLVLPEGDEALPAELRPEGDGRLRSLVAVPVLRGGEPAGFLCCGSAAGGAEWELRASDFLDIAADLVTDTLANLANYDRMQYLAYHDQLTGLPNRLLFKDRLATAMKLADRTAKLVGVVYFDLDSFKVINDTMGHELGDLLLSKVAGVLGGRVREYDTVSRFGGDEFVLILDQLPDTQSAVRAMEKLMEAIRQPVDLMGQECFVTGSAGVALYPQDGGTAEELITNADIAMYHAKGMGKNHWVLCSQDMKDRIVGQVKLRNLLYRALEREELFVLYQPQVQMGTGKIAGVEALLRWRLPGRGVVSPAEFIPIAEKSGLICPIGAWVLETACRQSVSWRRKGIPPVRMAVNISVQQLRDQCFASQVADILEKTGLPPGGLELEVTESVANSAAADIPGIFAGLKELGLSISIDDFGTEYSSLNRLKLLPVDRLKLDIRFVRGIEGSDKDRAITQVIINLAKSLHMKIVAEGVETPGQLAYLSERMCDEVQGFYYYRPMPAEEVEKLLAGEKEKSAAEPG